MTRPRRAGRSRCCCSSRNRYDPEEVSAHGIAGATAKPKKAAGLSPSTRAHSGQADSTNSHAERLRFDGSGKDKSSVEGSSPCKVEAPVHSRSPGSIGSGHSSRVQNLHIPDVPRCRKKGEGKNTMVNIRKPRSFGADGWLKINLPDDEDTEWFRRVRNIVTSNPPSAAELGHTRTLEPTEIAPGIFLGDAIHAQDLAKLRHLGITHVLNCATASETQTGAAFYRSRGCDSDFSYSDSPHGLDGSIPFEYMELGATDDELSSLVEPYLSAVVSFIDSALMGETRVLVHCVKGINRSSGLCIAYLMKRNRTPLLTAVTTVWERRPCVLTNESFCRELARLGRKLGLLEAPLLHSAPVTVAERRERPATLEDLMG